MIRPTFSIVMPRPALRRLAAIAALDSPAIVALRSAIDHVQLLPVHSELLVEGAPVGEPRLIVSGWAARVRILADGRRQFLSFLLPGDVIGLNRHARPVAVCTVTAITEVGICPLPDAAGSPALAEAYAVSQALDEAYLLAHIVRLGRLNAQERIGDLLLELAERLAHAGLADNDSFHMPLTQEMLGDALGLTSVHINRMLQIARRDGVLSLRGGRVTLHDRAALARSVGRAPVRIAAMPH